MPIRIFGRDGSSGSTAGLSRRVLAWLFWPSMLSCAEALDDGVVGALRRLDVAQVDGDLVAVGAQREQLLLLLVDHRLQLGDLLRAAAAGDRGAAGDAPGLGRELLLQLADLRLELLPRSDGSCRRCC